MVAAGFRRSLLAGFLAGCLALGDEAAAQRVPNTTLNVPQKPLTYGYQAIPAFPGLFFDQPVALVSPPGDTNRLFIVEKSGRIQVITNLAAPTKTLFLDLTDRVNPDGEGGLLGLAFHPGWSSNRLFYVFYTSSTDVPAGFTFFDHVSRFEINPDNSNSALPDSELRLLSQLDEQSNHNAGDVHFGPDGYLYVSTGDEGSGGDYLNNSRFINKDYFSAILRLDVDRRPGSLAPNPHPAVQTNALGEAFYAIPPDNPFLGATNFDGAPIAPGTVRTEFWAVGLRNPWRFSFDPTDGTLYCADVGQGSREEVNVVDRGGDYGWRYREGLLPHSGTVPAGVILADPIIDYGREVDITTAIPGGEAVGNSVTGGVVYRGARFAQLHGLYVFGDFGSGRIFALRYLSASREATEFQQLTSVPNPAAFGTDPSNGDVLIARIDGVVSRLIYSTTPVGGQALPALLSQTGAFSNLATLTPHPGIVAYDLNVPFWSDHAIKSRWFSIPDAGSTMTFSSASNWSFPTGQVWIKHFELELTNGVPPSRVRLETRFLVRNGDGVHGFTYRWNSNQTDAVLVGEAGSNEVITIRQPGGDVLREQLWRYPSRAECLQCHTAQGGHALGFNSVQLNRERNFGQGPTNQIAALGGLGYFDSPVNAFHTLPALSAPDDAAASLEWRVRSYLQANCAQCHRPGGTAPGHWDARLTTATDAAGLIDGPLLNTQGDLANRVLAPGDLAHSEMLRRISIRGPGQMPPLGSTISDPAGVALLSGWITNALPARRTFAQWQVDVFGSTNAPNAAPGNDFDGDLADNYSEWLAGTDATNRNSIWVLRVHRTGGMPEVSFEQPANRAVQVLFKDSLLTGVPWQTLEVPGNRPSYPMTNRPMSVPDPTATGGARFYRGRLLAP